jgi:hypothetical protein
LLPLALIRRQAVSSLQRELLSGARLVSVVGLLTSNCSEDYISLKQSACGWPFMAFFLQDCAISFVTFVSFVVQKNLPNTCGLLTSNTLSILTCSKIYTVDLFCLQLLFRQLFFNDIFDVV